MAPQPKQNSKRGKKMRKYKHHTLYIVIIVMLFFLITVNNSDDASSLSYQSNIDIGFTFLPTLNVSLSSDSLTINNLIPGGNAADSNTITINVSTNIAEGYNLYAAVGNSNNGTTNLTNVSNNNYTFTPLSSNISELSNFTNNTWGYSYCVSNCSSASTPDTPNPNWISGDYNNASTGYNGLPLYTDTGIKLVEEADNTSSTVDFKIAAKAGSTQPSGEYTNAINFTVTSNTIPTTMLDAFIASGAQMHNGYFKMQDMTPTICKSIDTDGEKGMQLIDVRDDKLYWVAKLKDGNCWMTQNLDLNLIQNKTYTHADTDLGWGPNAFDANATWSLTTDPNWAENKYAPYYVDPGDKYVYTSNSDADDIVYDSLSSCVSAGHTDCEHYHIGNYYNWNAARANGEGRTSICPAGWRLPDLGGNEYGNLLTSHNIIQDSTSTTYLENGFNGIRKAPLYFVRAGQKGDIDSTDVLPGVRGAYLYNKTTVFASYMNFNKTTINPIWNNQYFQIQGYGDSVRCLAR